MLVAEGLAEGEELGSNLLQVTKSNPLALFSTHARERSVDFAAPDPFRAVGLAVYHALALALALGLPLTGAGLRER
jgi:hypothetical protein